MVMGTERTQRGPVQASLTPPPPARWSTPCLWRPTRDRSCGLAFPGYHAHRRDNSAVHIGRAVPRTRRAFTPCAVGRGERLVERRRVGQDAGVAAEAVTRSARSHTLRLLIVAISSHPSVDLSRPGSDGGSTLEWRI